MTQIFYTLVNPWYFEKFEKYSCTMDISKLGG